MNKTVKTLAAMMFGCFSLPVLATEAGDTIVIEDVSKVKIETRDTVQRIVINGTKEDAAFQYVQRIAIPDTSAVRRSIKSVRDFNKIVIKKDGKPTKWSSSFHMNIGMNTMLNAPDGYNFKAWPSFEIGFAWTADFHPYGKKNEWSIGLGFDIRQFKSSKSTFWAKDAQNTLVLVDYPAGQTETSTYLSQFSLQVPLLYTHRFDDKGKWKVTLGALVNFNVHAEAIRNYEENGEEFNVTTKKIGARPVTVDGLLVLGTPWLPDLYCKYCPMTFFKDNRGPKIHQLSFGICF